MSLVIKASTTGATGGLKLQCIANFLVLIVIVLVVVVVDVVVTDILFVLRFVGQ